VTSLGSTLTLKLLSDKPVFHSTFGIYSHRIGDRWLAGGASNTGGAVLSHFFTSNEIASLCKDINPGVSTNLNYYPLLKPGERFPVNDPQLAPRLQPRPKKDHEFLQGILEGIASVEQLGYQQLVTVGGPKVQTIRSVGGGASNTVFTTIREKLINAEFKQTTSEEAAYGVALLAVGAADKMRLW